jgi:hypothetical protein
MRRVWGVAAAHKRGRRGSADGGGHKHSRADDAVGGGRALECKTCGQAFAQSGSLAEHMRSHTGVGPHVCETCGKAFTQSGDLVNHMRIHSGEKPHVCELCGKAFSMRNMVLCTMLRAAPGYVCSLEACLCTCGGHIRMICKCNKISALHASDFTSKSLRQSRSTNIPSDR